MPVLRSVNVGRPKDKQWAGLGYTSIDKRPVTGPVRAHRMGLVGDVVSDTLHHGGADQAVYAFAREDLDRWRIGTALFEVASVRTPCNDFKGWMGESGFDDRQWVKRFMAECRPGPYLRVLQPGEITAGDEIETVHRQGHGVTVSTMFRAINLDHSLLPQLLRIEGLVEQARAKA